MTAFIKKLFFLLILLVGVAISGCTPVDDKTEDNPISGDPVYYIPSDIEYDGPRLDMSFLTVTPYGYHGEGNPYRGTGGAFYVSFDPANGKGRHIDGDTTAFIYPSDVVSKITANAKSVRYFNVDTPESTTSKEEWGYTASYYTKDMLLRAEEIILQTDPGDNFLDRYGRLLGWVWIRLPEDDDFILLNYLLVRHGIGEVKYLYGGGSTQVTKYLNYTYTEWMLLGQMKAEDEGRGMHGTLLDYYWDYSKNAPYQSRLQ